MVKSYSHLLKLNEHWYRFGGAYLYLHKYRLGVQQIFRLGNNLIPAAELDYMFAYY